MRVIVFFDLPVVEYYDRKEYTRFRKYLIKDGFIMMQQSVYSKLAVNYSAANFIKESVRKQSPKKGTVQLLIITEKQYSGIDYIIGSPQNLKMNDEERLVIL